MKGRRAHENACCLAIMSVVLPVFIAQVGLASSSMLPPLVGWQLYVYGSATSGVAAVILGARALFTFTDGCRSQAIISTATGLCVIGLLILATHVTTDHKLPVLNDVSTDLHDVPKFHILDANDTSYPAEYAPLVREYYEDIAKPRHTLLPIGAAFMRALHVAEEMGWKVVTPIEHEVLALSPCSVYLYRALT